LNKQKIGPMGAAEKLQSDNAQNEQFMMLNDQSNDKSSMSDQSMFQQVAIINDGQMN